MLAYVVVLFQLWAKTLAGAATLVTERTPVLVGALDSIRNEDETLDSLMSWFSCIQAARSDLTAATARKIVMPHISLNLVFQTGDAAIITSAHNDRETVVGIRRLLSVCVKGDHRVVVEGDMYRQVGIHRVTGCRAILPSQAKVFVLAERLLRKAILVPSAGHHFLLLDYMRPYPVTEASSVLVPAYVELNDMVLIMGDGDEVWCGRVVGCDSADKTKPIRINFYIESQRHRNHYKKESNRIDEVHLNSITGIAQGRWEDDYRKWIAHN